MATSTNSESSPTNMASNVETREKSFDQVFVPLEYDDRTPSTLCQDIVGYTKTKCVPSKQCSQSYIKTFLPFLSWLKIYEIGWLPSDIICGLTVAIMQIPQGMGYALLARLPAIIGLYISFFPSLIYVLFGTSRHLSMGAIAVISLMTGNVVDRFSTQTIYSNGVQTNASNATIEMMSNNVLNDPVTIATTLAFSIGIIQLILCIFHLGFVTSFLSDSFISGYTTSTAILVLISQIPDILGLTLKRFIGPFNIVYTLIEIFRNLKNINIPTLIISICSILTLILVKEYIEPFYKKQIKKIRLFKTVQIPIPIDLILIIVGTLASYYFDLNRQHQVKIVNTIGRGFRAPQAPQFTLIPRLFKDAIIISIVSFTISISLAKTFAKKFKYDVDSNQELLAYGLSNIFGAFFSSYPSAGSLSRTSVFVNVGGRTQLASLISSIFLLTIILRIGTFFEPLPKACLASIIAVALKGLLLQTKDMFTIGRITKLESIVWIVTFLSTIILDVDYGLIVGIFTSFIVVILRQFRPRITILGEYDRNKAHKTTARFTDVHEISKIKIFRFESPIIYYNADYFRDSLFEKINKKSTSKKEEYPVTDSTLYIVIDCSSISQIDYSGGKLFLQAIKELNDYGYHVYLCHLRYYNYDVLEKLEMHKVCSVTITATIHDAVHRIQDHQAENNDGKLKIGNGTSLNKIVPILSRRFSLPILNLFFK